MPMKIPLFATVALGVAFAAMTTAQAAPTTLSADDMSGLNQAPSTQFDEVYVRDGIARDGLYVERVRLGIGDPRDRYMLGTRDLERLRAGFENALRANSADADASVTLEVTLTELVPNRVITETASRTSRYNRSVGIGRASMEAVFRDASTGDVLMVIVDERSGLPLSHNFHNLTGRIWGDASDILKDWAEELPAVF